MRLEVTEAQLRAIINMTDDLQAMIGQADEEDDTGKTTDDHWNSYIRLVDRMLKKNGYSR